jgi:hypothetical protein
MTPEALSLLIEAGLDAMNVDVKGDAAAVRKYCKGIDANKVWAACKLARSRGVHVEITTLVIPGVNDAEAALRGIAQHLVTDLGADVPWYVTAYRPAYQFTAPPTPVQTLDRAWQMGREAGLEFVYTGNVPGHRYDNTYCPACGGRLVRRFGFDVLLNAVRHGQCPQCRRPIAGVWRGTRGTFTMMGGSLAYTATRGPCSMLQTRRGNRAERCEHHSRPALWDMACCQSLRTAHQRLGTHMDHQEQCCNTKCTG